MENEKASERAHCLVLPFPIQGHINPMIQFSKRLQHKGVKITLLTSGSVFKDIVQQSSTSIDIDTISGFYEEGHPEAASSAGERYARFKDVGQKHLAEIVEKFQKTESPVNCIVYDPFLPWALEVAKGFGLVGAAFFTQSCAVNNIYYHVHEKILELPIKRDVFSIEGLPPLGVSDLPSFLFVPPSPRAYLDLVLDQFGNLSKADWVLCNSFTKLEEEVEDWMAKVFPLRTIGPTVPSMYLDTRLQNDKDYGLSMFKPNTSDCMNWLDQKASGSVIYVSFGSMVELGVAQMEEIADALKNSNLHFLWVVRSKEQSKLPTNFGLETADIGLIVTWCSQLEVLAHRAIGCFVTHCGWNSVLEALSLGIPMICMPYWSDQATNAKFVADVWKVGLRLEHDSEDGLVRKEKIESCIGKVMEGEKREELMRNAMKLKELAIQAVDERGSSDMNIDKFIANLLVCDLRRP